jgi:DnaJ like chaperone protein
MGKFTKWIAGGLGWALLGPVGGILGFVLGSFLEMPQQQMQARGTKTTTGDFAVSLLVMVAAVLKADGKVVKSELDYVKRYFIQTFGQDSASEAILMLRDLLKQSISLKDVATQVGYKLDYASRLQMLHFLYGVAKADGTVHPSEQEIIEKAASYMGIGHKDIESIRSMFVPRADGAYKVLGVEQNATNEEIKAAYRQMAKKYHPDKVEYLGEDFKKVAHEKFQKINEAYEQLKKARNIA